MATEQEIQEAFLQQKFLDSKKLPPGSSIPPPSAAPASTELKDTLKDYKRQQMTHTGKTRSYKGPGTYNPLVHAGKMMMDIGSGMRQLVSGTDNPFSREVQQMADIYEEYDQPGLGIAGGLMLMAAPELLASPAAMPATALPFAAATRPLAGPTAWKTLAKEIGEQSARGKNIVYPPGVKGGVEGTVYGGASHINPESTNPIAERLKAAAAGAAFGSGLDALTTNARLALSKQAADKQRKIESGNLPKTVRLPGPELWSQKSQATRAKQFREGGSDASWRPGQRTKELYESGYAKAADDIDYNAEEIRKDITGKTGPVTKGKELTNMSETLQAKRKAEGNEAFSAVEKEIASPSKIYFDADEYSPLINKMGQIAYNAFGTGKMSSKIRSILDSLEGLQDKAKYGVADGKDLLRLKQEIINATQDSNTLNQNIARKLGEELDTFITSIQYSSPGKQPAIDKFLAANSAVKNYYEKYSSNPIIDSLTKGKKSTRQISDELFGDVNPTDTANRLDALNKLINPGASGSEARRNALKHELLQQMYSGQGKEGKEFNMSAFVDQYGKAADTGEATQMINMLFDPKDQKLLSDLYNVSGKLTGKRLGTEGYVRTSVPAQAATVNTTPTIETLANLLPGSKFEDYMNAARYGSGRQYAVGNPLMAGKIGGIMGGEVTGETTDEIRNPSPPSQGIELLLRLLGVK